MSFFNRLRVNCLLVLYFNFAAINAVCGLEFGPLAHEFDLTLESGRRTEILGPLFSREVQNNAAERTWPPFMHDRVDRGLDSAEFDFLYPLVGYRRFGTEYRLQFLQLVNFSGGQTQSEHAKRRVALFPFYFQQRSTEPGQNYTALLPFYGHLQNHLFRDEINFVLVPIYFQSRKKDVVTDNYLMPFFHLRHGNLLTGWQLWPLVGNEHKEVTTRTNSLDEVEIVGGHKKFFLLWPIFFREALDLGTTNSKTLNALLPLYNLERSPVRDSSTYLWPFFTFTNDREKRYHEQDLCGPLLAFARGEGKTMNRVWPLFGHAHNATFTNNFYLWPLYKYNSVYAPPLHRERRRVGFYLFSDLIERNLDAGTALHRTECWPFFTYRHDANGNQRLQILALWEPILPTNNGIQKTYSPFWSLWRSEKNGKTGATSQSLLWNLYRRDATPTTKKCSLLFGLFQYQTGPEHKQVRLFYLPFGKRDAAPKSPPPN
ncbi:MAG: hypothetical protein HY043_18930 [Verrucomicrobia bacterium]|nr:hypothetical protein [Verrucomicrobiota bacterium]